MKYISSFFFLLNLSLNGAESLLDSDDTYHETESDGEEDTELQQLLLGVHCLGVISPMSNTPIVQLDRPENRLATASENKNDHDSSTQSAFHSSKALLQRPSPSDQIRLLIEERQSQVPQTNSALLEKCSPLLKEVGRSSSTLSSLAGRCSSSVLSPADRLLSPAILEMDNFISFFNKPYDQTETTLESKNFFSKSKPYGRRPSNLKNNTPLKIHLKELEKQCNHIS